MTAPITLQIERAMANNGDYAVLQADRENGSWWIIGGVGAWAEPS